MKEDDHMGKPSYDTLKTALGYFESHEFKTLLESQKDAPPGFNKLLEDNFWKLLADD
jgi:hypothetical protein